MGAYGTVTKGALMAFENDHGMTDDGIPGAAVWKALISAVVAGKVSTFGYTFVTVDEASQSLNLWHSGKTVIGGTPVNTGIASAPTATGTYPVYEHLPVTTMSGTNPDGSHYSDPGIPDVSYFNGGDALHGFDRAAVRLTAEPRVRGDALQRGRAGLSVHADRHPGRRHLAGLPYWRRRRSARVATT